MIEQALYGSQGSGGYRFLARSRGFLDDWLPLAEQLCTGFGERPAGVACPQALFARPFGKRHVAVVQVADQGVDDAGRPGALGFRLLIVPADLYSGLGGDLFRIADVFPPSWSERGELESLEWVEGPTPPRTVEEVRQVLQTHDSPTMLGAAQVLLDGGKVVFERPSPDTDLVRGLWTLLPTASRSEIWPTTFAFANTHRFDVLVTPRTDADDHPRYVPKSMTGDYPEGRYERQLQAAAETHDQVWLDNLMGRRSRGQTVRLVVVLLVVFLIAAPIMQMLSPPPPQQEQKQKEEGKEKEKKEEKLRLPPAEEFPRLEEPARARLAERLQGLGRRLGVELPGGSEPEELEKAVAELDRALAARVKEKGTRTPGKLSELGPVQRQLRGLLWKHGGPGFAEMKLNEVELVDQLTEQLEKAGLIKEDDGD